MRLPNSTLPARPPNELLGDIRSALGVASDDLLSRLLDATDLVVYLTDLDGRYLLANQAFGSLWQIDPASAVGKTDHDLFEEATADAFRQNDLLVLGSNRKQQFEETGETLHGRRVYISEKFPLLDAGGAVYAVAGMSTDVTDRVEAERKLRESEDRYRAVVETTSEGVWTFDRDGLSTFVNQPLAEMLGYMPHEMVGRPLTDFVTDDDRETAEAGLARRRAGIPEQHELCLVRSDGSSVWTLVTSNPFHDGDGSFAGMLKMVTDISALKEAQNLLGETNQELRDRLSAHQTDLASALKDLAEMTRELEGFSYSVSHDLRAPLRSIDGFSKALMDDLGDDLPPAARQDLERVRGATQRMGVMIDAILQLARISRAELTPRPLDLSQLAMEAGQDLDAEQEREARVTLDVKPGVRAFGDKELIRLVVKNLLSNAWKFTARTDGARVEVGAVDGDPGGFYVRDNGAGFDPAFADKLFRPFERLHRADEFPGTGIGLSIIHRVVRRHGGSVRADAAEGRGATFYVHLPATPSEGGPSNTDPRVEA